MPANTTTERAGGAPARTAQGAAAKPARRGKKRHRMPASERKRQITLVTMRLVAQYGVKGTTIARIAAAAGVTEPALYNHFANRREILIAALDSVFEGAADVMRSSQEPDALERLRGIFQVHTDTVLASSEEQGFPYPLFEFVIAPAEDRLREHLKVRQLDMVKALVEIVDEGKRQGTIRTDVDSQLVAWEVMGLHWTEDVSHLMGFDELMTSGRTTAMLESILERIAVHKADAPAA
jgi:TetR/AcrR family transcriptional regulator